MKPAATSTTSTLTKPLARFMTPDPKPSRRVEASTSLSTFTDTDGPNTPDRR